MALSHESLVTFYKMNSLLSIKGYFTLDIIEAMLPWERDVHISILLEHKKKQEENSQ